MLTIGVDVASEAREKTASCSIEWSGGHAKVVDVVSKKVGDADIQSYVQEADVVGLDVPLGWPKAFVGAVHGHHSQPPTWPEPAPRMHRLRLRKTDRWIKRVTGLAPLSVSAGWIAVPALRIAALRIGEPRDGSGKVVEVYPKAAMKVWELPYEKYKGKRYGASSTALTPAGIERDRIVGSLQRKGRGWLYGDGWWGLFRDNDDALDALIAALVARAWIQGLCHPISARCKDDAAVEGWIALPCEDSLRRLPV